MSKHRLRLVFAVGLVVFAGICIGKLRRPGSLEAWTGSAYRASLLWGCLVLASFTGWGRLIQRLCGIRRGIDIGLSCAWGMAFTITLGGLLSAFSLATRAMICAVVVTGILAWIVQMRFTWKRARLFFAKGTTDLAYLCGGAAVLSLALLQFAGAPGHKSYYWGCDDAPAYLVMPAQLLQIGSFVQPFSLRGMTSFGGQSLFTALFMAHVPAEQLQLVDRGACLLMMLALVLSFPARSTSRRWLLLPAALLVTLPDIRANTTSMLSGAVLLLALCRTLLQARLAPTRAYVLIAMIAAAVIALRHNYVVPSIVTVAMSFGLRLVRGRRPWADRKRILQEALATAGLAALFLVPWGYVSFRSCGTYLYPIMKGNYHPQLGALRHSDDLAHTQLFHDLIARAHLIWTNVTHDGPVKTIALFMLAGLFVNDRSERRGFQSLLLGSAIGFLALLFAFLWAEPEDYARYYFGYEVACVMAISLACLVPTRARTHPRNNENAGLPSPVGAIAPAIVVLATVLQLHDLRANTATMYSTLLDWVDGAHVALAHSEIPADAVYRDLQRSVPEGEGIFTLLDEPFRLDFRRNIVYIGDLPGVVSPNSTLPLADEAQFVAYLRSLSIRYFAYTTSESSAELYNAKHWAQLAGSGVAIHMALAPIMAQVFAIESACRQAHRVLFDRDGMVVIDVASDRS